MAISVSSNVFSVVGGVSAGPSQLFLVLDCSGSTMDFIDQMRTDTKNIVASCANPDMLIHVIWFSGDKESGVLQRDLKISDLACLSAFNHAVDTFLRSRGLTAFRRPLELVAEIERSHPNMPSRVFFMTDGCLNDCSRQDVFSALSKVRGNITFVPYGNYADVAMIRDMAAAKNAVVAFAPRYENLREKLQESMQQQAAAVQEVQVPDDAEEVFVIVGQNAVPVPVVNQVATVPTNARDRRVYSLRSRDAAKRSRLEEGQPDSVQADALLSSLLYAVQQGKPNVWDFLRELGDVELAKQFSLCNTDQDMARFEDMVRACLFDESKRYVSGWNKAVVPAEDAFTMIDLFILLRDDPDALFYAGLHEYVSIGRKTVPKLSEDEQKATETINSPTASAAEKKKARSMLRPVFTANKEKGSPIDDLVFNEKRANVSVRISIPGVAKCVTPDGRDVEIPAYRWRNRTFIRDGKIHESFRIMPFSFSKTTFDVLQEKGVLPADETWEQGKVFHLKLDLPAISPKTKGKVKADVFFGLYVKLLRAEARQRFIGSMIKDDATGKSVGRKREQDYSKVDAFNGYDHEWLGKMGFRDDGSWDELVVSAPSTDKYMAPTLEVKIEGCSDLPKVDEKVLKKLKDGGARFVEELYAEAYAEWNSVADKQKWAKEEYAKAGELVKSIRMELVPLNWAILVGKAFPLPDRSKPEYVVKDGGKDFKCTIVLGQKEEKI